MDNRVSVAQLNGLLQGSVVSVRAILRSLQMKRTVSGDLWAALEIVEAGVSVVVLVFSRIFASVGEGVLSNGAVLDVAGPIAFRGADKALRLNARSIEVAAAAPYGSV